jgi:hypothetical protein
MALDAKLRVVELQFGQVAADSWLPCDADAD